MASPTTGNPLLLPWLAAVLTCIQGNVWLLSPVFLPQGRVLEREFIAEEANVTPHSTWVNFAVQRKVTDAQYAATKLSKCLFCWKGKVKY